MELSLLTEKVKLIFDAETPQDLPAKIMDHVLTDSEEKYQQFVDTVNDLTQDWLQMIYQYWLADRDIKKQDYTPKTIANLVSRLALQKTNEAIVDICAGSGALVIQSWSIAPDTKFECTELDENVLPILLFNLAVRNISAVVKHGDALSGECFATYKVEKREKYGKVEKVENCN